MWDERQGILIMLNIDALRNETPGVQNKIHFNNAGAALMPQPVLDVMHEHMNLEATIGGYEAADKVSHLIERVYVSIGKMLGAHKTEISLMENSTMAWNKAFFGIPFKEGDRILTCISEYGANFIGYLQIVKWKGVKVEIVPNTSSGIIDCNALRSMIDERVRLISITHVPTNNGLINPAVEVGKIANEHNILYILDACQSVGQIPLNVDKIGCDMLSAAGRKWLRGPRGAGFLYVRNSVVKSLEPPMIDHFASRWIDPSKYQLKENNELFELWEKNYVAHLGQGAAVVYAQRIGLRNIEKRVRYLAVRLRDGLETIPGITVRDIGVKKCAIVTFDSIQKPSEEIVRMLHKEDINSSVTSEDSTLLDFRSRKLSPLVRLSPHYYNTDNEVDIVLDVIAKTLHTG